MRMASFFKASLVVKNDGCSFTLSKEEEHAAWLIFTALLSIAVGPFVSIPWAGETVPSDSVVPAYLPSGVAPIIDPPAT